MEDDIRNYLPTVMFRGTPCRLFTYFETKLRILKLEPSVTLKIENTAVSYVTSVNICMCPTKLLIIVIIKCLSYSEISAIMCSLFSVLFLFNLGKHVHKWEKILSSLINMTLGTSCIIGPFLCCHLFYRVSHET